MVRRFGGVRAVDGASFAVEEGSITSLIGPNGAGKSTLFNVVSGFLRADDGRVLLDGQRIERRPPHAIARAGLVRTFQTPRALGRMTVRENVLLAASEHPGERLPQTILRPRRCATAGAGRAGAVGRAARARPPRRPRRRARLDAVGRRSASCSTSRGR